MKSWIWLIVAAALVAIGAGVYVFRAEIAVAMVQRTAARSMAESLPAQLPEGLHAAFCGTGSPFPDRTRAGPCLAVIAGARVFVFDAGEGASETLSLMGISPGAVEAVFLTHVHSDHFDGLAPLALQHWAQATARTPLRVLGPPGTARTANGLNEAYAVDSVYRTEHHGEAIMPSSGFGLAPEEFEAPAAGEMRVVLDDDGVRILAFRVEHAPVDGAVGYRIEYAGRSIVISGDTARSDAVVRAARGADLLVHEALSPRLNRLLHSAAQQTGRENVATIFDDILDYHTSPADAGRVATDANVGALALTHIIPPTPLPGLSAVFVREARTTFRGPVYAMRDGDVISLPSAGGLRRSRHIRF